MSKMANMRGTTASFWLGTALLIIVSSTMMVWHTIDNMRAIVLVFGLAIMMTSYLTYIGVDRKGRDERARKIGTMAATLSWYVSLVFVGVLAAVSYWIGRQIDMAEAFGVAIFVMTVTMAGLTAYYNIRGDVE